MGQTLVQKIFAAHVGQPVKPDEIVISPVDFVFSHDGNRPQPIQTFASLGGQRVFDPAKIAFFLDHAPNVHTTAVAQLHEQMRRFAAEHGVTLYDIGRGISHQVIPEEGHAVPGRIIVGSDSHTCTAGAFNLLSTGVGSADLAVAMMLGKLWFRVPETMRLISRGRLSTGVSAKDLVLYWVGRIGADGAIYRTLEFTGEAITGLSMQQRMTVTNMSIEMGAKFGVMEADEITRGYLAARGVTDFDTYRSDADADFIATHETDVSALPPQVAAPPSPDLVRPVTEFRGTPIAQATIGTSTNGQLDDLRAAAAVLAGNKIAPGVRLFVAPASRRTYFDAIKEGLVERFLEAGAIWGTPGCSGCTGGSAFGVPADGQNMITSAPRNFIGRTGNRHANIYLASPETVMASAIEGQIADPRPYLSEHNDKAEQRTMAAGR
jgi:3-isopropylmalate/(R)-2-methylmalate dehydratase large subunit